MPDDVDVSETPMASKLTRSRTASSGRERQRRSPDDRSERSVQAVLALWE